MTRLALRTLIALLVAVLCSPAFAAALDEGRLEPAWFGGDVSFRSTDEVDYLWVKPGFELRGSSLHIDDWEDPQMLGPKKRDAKDAARAVQLTDQFPGLLRGALMTSLDGVATTSRKEGSIRVVGRVVDCNAGSKAAKMLVGLGAGSATATWDMKFLDAETGEVLLALHHRAISGTAMSEIDDKVVKWLEKFGALLRAGPATAYAGGKPPKQ